MPDPNSVVSRTFGASGLHPLDVGTDKDGLEWSTGEYWTPERMAAAAPVSLAVHTHPAGKPVNDVDSHELVQAQFQTQRVGSAGQAPYRYVGKLFMTFGSDDSWATAWQASERVVVTAGHCLYDHRRGSVWADRLLYVPHFGSGQAMKLGATASHVLHGWYGQRSGMYDFDLGAVSLAAPIPLPGGLGWVAAPAGGETAEALGYPLIWLSPLHDFDGTQMWSCRAGVTNGPSSAWIANNMTEGCSGGPWLVRRHGAYRVAGVNSFRPPGQPEVVRSPLLGGGLPNLLASA